MIKKYNIITSIEFNKKYNKLVFFINYCKNYTNFSEEKIYILSFLLGVFWHLLFPLIALYYVKDYIKDYIKTEFAVIKAFIIFIIYGLFNIFIIDIFKVYKNSLELTKTEFNIIVTSIVLTYISLLYYFESIKNRINY